MRYVCTGRIHLERVAAGFGRYELRSTVGWKAVVSCQWSQISVVLDFPDDTDPMSSLRAQPIAIDLANTFVGALGLALDLAYSVEIVQVIEPNGLLHISGIGYEDGQTDQASKYHTGVDIGRELKLSIRDSHFRMAIRDNLRAITAELDGPFLCYRAIEAIKSSFVTQSSNSDSQAWKTMHKELGTDRAMIEDSLKPYADPLRHGSREESGNFTPLEQTNMLKLTRDVLSKYMDYRTPQTSQ